MELILFKNFTKKRNSTKQPVDSTGTMVEIYLKQNTSIEQPVFILSGNLADFLDVNYCKFSNSYYYVDDIIVTNNNVLEIYASMDALATMRAYIGNSEQYIDRASNALAYQGDAELLADTFYPTLPTFTKHEVIPTNRPNWATDGVYVLGILDGDNIKVFDGTSAHTPTLSESFIRGGIRYFITSATGAKEFINSITAFNLNEDNQRWEIFQYIASFTYIPLPVKLTAVGTTQFIILDSDIAFDFTCYSFAQPTPNSVVNGVAQLYGSSITYQKWDANLLLHPGFTNNGQYVNYNPFTTYVLHAGPFGDITIPQELITKNALDFYAAFSVTCDLVTGEAFLAIHSSAENVQTNVIYRQQANIGISISLDSQVAIGAHLAKLRYQETKQRALFDMGAGIATSILSANYAGAVTSVINADRSVNSAYYDYASASVPQAVYRGSNGSYSDLWIAFTITCYYKDIYPKKSIDLYGRPASGKFKISDIPGYIKCHTFVAAMPCTNDEYAKIEAFATSGFYYE